jgi:hypothetical protein
MWAVENIAKQGDDIHRVSRYAKDAARDNRSHAAPLEEVVSRLAGRGSRRYRCQAQLLHQLHTVEH